MSAKRPRPAIPVLVHVDNPAEVGSVTVDTSTIEGKMDTVINNQNRIYDKIPTSSGGSSADLTTVNEKITTLATATGTTSSTTGANDLVGLVKNLRGAVGILGTALPPNSDSVRALLFNIRGGIGNSTNDPTSTGTSVRDLLTAIKENTASGGSGGGADLTTVNEKITAINDTVGSLGVSSKDPSLLGVVMNIKAAVGFSENSGNKAGTSVKDRLYNIQSSIGDDLNSPSATGTTVRDLLTAIKQNTASGGGGGGGGGSADLTTVNEKTTALATAIGSADDSSSTVSVIGLLKSITDKY